MAAPFILERVPGIAYLGIEASSVLLRALWYKNMEAAWAILGAQ